MGMGGLTDGDGQMEIHGATRHDQPPTPGFNVASLTDEPGIKVLP